MSSGLPDLFPRLLGDIGGTNARFALQYAPGAAFEASRTLACAEFPSLAAAMRQYLDETGARPHWCAFGIANPVTGDLVRMTNHHWSFSISELKYDLGLTQLLVLNDFTALALALPVLGASELAQVGGAAPERDAPKALLGPGTGLGMSGLIPSGAGDYAALAGEGGHITMAAHDAREAEIIARLRERYDHVSAERVLCGRGLADLYEISAAMVHRPCENLTSAEVSARGIAGTDAACTAAVETFCAMLGTAAGDLALILGAFGGVYIGGGIVPKMGEYFARSPFRARFEQKGRFASYLARIPVYVIHAHYPALLGAARALDRLGREAG